MADTSANDGAVLGFDAFWRWVQRHPNCILRLATPEVVVFDDDDLHWHFDPGENGLVFVQVIRGKRLMAEVAIRTADVALVQSGPAEEGEVAFDLVLQGGEGDAPAYTFFLSHGFEDEQPLGPARWVH